MLLGAWLKQLPYKCETLNLNFSTAKKNK
jgi:hypothetical protein